MMKTIATARCTLAIDLSGHGFGYAVLERGVLVDWGVQRVSAPKQASCIRRVTELLRWYAPATIVLEDTSAPGSRRGPRIRSLSQRLRRLAKHFGLEPMFVHWRVVQERLGGSQQATKQEIVEEVARRFPELRRRMPAKRKLWTSEDDRTSLFDAVALGIAAMRLAASGEGAHGRPT